MTQLRDARLRRAMDEAPDAGLQPPGRTREAIRAAAHAAVRPWWQRGWAAAAGRTPWAAAFASVLLATLVTVMWWDEEVPGARGIPPQLDRPAAAPPAGAPAPAAPTAPAAQAPVHPAPMGPASPVVPGPAAAGPTSPSAPAVPTVTDPVAGPTAPPARSPAAAPAQPARERLAPSAAAPATTQGELRQSRGEPPEAARPAARTDPAPGSEVPAVAEAPAAAPRLAVPPPVAAARPPASPSARFTSPPPAAEAPPAAGPPAPAPDWTQVRIEAEGRSAVLPRGQAGSLADLVERMLATQGDAAVPAGAAVIRLELTDANGIAGRLELAGERWHWTPLRVPQPTRVLRPEPALAAALGAEAQRLLRQ